MPTASPVPSHIDQMLQRMTPEQKIGQTMMIGFDGTTIPPDLREMIDRYHVGGVILFARNVESPAQVGRLTNEMQSSALRSGGPGLLIAADQEGGRVARLTERAGFTEFPSAMALAATGDPDNARRVAQAIAAEMRAVGLNTDFAPVLDVNNNPANPVIGARSYGDDPAQVAAYGLAAIDGLQSGGVLAFGKHFPGHGDTAVDSHYALPVIAHDRSRLEAVEFVPFKAAIAAHVAGIMSAHVTFPAIDPTPGLPATLSPAVMTGLLRDELGYDGLLVSDSLEMGALGQAGYTPATAAPLALKAGADILLFNHGAAEHRAAFARILDMLRRGEISMARLDAAVRRILIAKDRFGLLDPTPVDVGAAAARAADPAHRALADDLAARSVTLLRDSAGLLPLAKDAQPCVIETATHSGLADLLGATGVPTDTWTTAESIHSTLAQVEPCRPLIVGLAGVAQHPEFVEMVNALLATGRPVILAALRDPYDLAAFPRAPTLLATYGAPPPSVRALAAVLRGQARAQGKMPVALR